MAYDPASGYRRLLPDEAPLIREEVADVLHLGPSQRAGMLLSVCRSAMMLLSTHPPEQRIRLLQHRDPLPPDSEQILARLRDQHRRSRP